MYRKREYLRAERRRDKAQKKESWFKNNNHESVMFVPATPGSSLAKLYKNTRKQALKSRTYCKEMTHFQTKAAMTPLVLYAQLM